MLRCRRNLFFPHRFWHTHTHTYCTGWDGGSRAETLGSRSGDD